MKNRAHFLVGATASGKTEVAHLIARRTNVPILSIDSMQVYRGMDLGTAKPTQEERHGIAYYGIDIADPDADFSLAQFCSYVSGIAGDISGDIIVCGGTGLYAKALTRGLEDGPVPDRELRERLDAMLAESGVEAIRQELKNTAPEVYASLKDKENPRRLMRAIERAHAGAPLADSWVDDSGVVLTGLDVHADRLKDRIGVRAAKMFADGIVDEVESLIAKHGALSRTASQAIGYSEALGVIAGNLSEERAVEVTATRTRQLAKKQRTWFRHQAEIDWIERSDSASIEELADLVIESWNRNGSVELKV